MDSSIEVFKQDLENNVKRHIYLISILDRLLTDFKTKFKNDKRWFYFSGALANQMLTHAKSLYLMSTEKIRFDTDDSMWETDHFDSSGMFANVRIQADAYATLHHIFFDNIHIEEKRLRFALWQIDSWCEQANFTRYSEKHFVFKFIRKQEENTLKT